MEQQFVDHLLIVGDAFTFENVPSMLAGDRLSRLIQVCDVVLRSRGLTTDAKSSKMPLLLNLIGSYCFISQALLIKTWRTFRSADSIQL
jgi:hypothetical protein